MTAHAAPVPRAGGLRLGDLVNLGARGLVSRRLRSALTALGIAIGIAAMVGVLGISEASRASLLAVLDRLGTNLLTVSPGQSFGGDRATLPDDAAAMIRRIGPVEAVSSATILQASVRRTDHISSSQTGGLAVVAAESTLLETLGGTIAQGRFLDAATERYPTVVLGSVAAQRLGIAELDAPIQVWIAGRWFTVIGILGELPLTPEIERSAIIGIPAAETFLDLDIDPSIIYVRPSEDSVDDVRSVLGATTNPQHPEEVLVSRPSEAVEAKAAAATTFTNLFLGLGAIALLVGGLGIANVMLMSVLERRSEIGLRRALGATRGHIAGQFLAEATVLAGVGGILGVALGVGIALGYAQTQAWPGVVPLIGVAGGLAGALLIGAVAGLYPAMRAAAVPPTEALRGT